MDEIILDMQKQLSYIIAYIDKQNVKDSDMLLSDYLINWLEVYRKNKVAPATYYKNNLIVKNQILPVLGDYKLCDLTVDMLQNYFNGLGVRRQTEHIYVLLKHALRQAVANAYLHDNPMQGVILARRIPRETLTFAVEQEHKFFETAKQYDDYYDFFRVLRYTGLRPGELLALTGADISDTYITVNKAIDTLGNQKPPKTKAGNRTVPIFDDIADLLAKYKGNSNRLFTFSLWSAEHQFKTVCKKLNMQGYTLYSLRHTFLTRCAEKGIHQKVVQKWAGHSTLQMTLKFYTHISEEWETDQIAKYNS